MTHSVNADDGRQAKGCAVRQPSPKKSPFPMQGDDRFLPLLGYDNDLDLALLDVENGVGGVALREDILIFSIGRYRPSAIHGAQEGFHVESLFFLRLSHAALIFLFGWAIF